MKPTPADRLLGRLYRLWDETAADWPLACRAGCHLCCTTDLVITSAEGRRIHHRLGAIGQEKRLDDWIAQAGCGMQPAVSINRLAALYAAGKEVDDPGRPAGGTGSCPALHDGRCLVYADRPLGCRVMVSLRRCRPDRAAQMDPFHLTVATVFQQVLEHLDRPGVTGNAADMLAAVAAGTVADDRFAANEPISVLAVVPEHQRRLAPLLARLNALVAEAFG